jgi:hypothetical protein
MGLPPKDDEIIMPAASAKEFVPEKFWLFAAMRV